MFRVGRAARAGPRIWCRPGCVVAGLALAAPPVAAVAGLGLATAAILLQLHPPGGVQ
ncbi:MAG TPA: hypothetical protein VH496_08970 [Mycobacterium sp.]